MTPPQTTDTATDPGGYRLERRGVLMHPDRADPNQAWGVLNPACARDRDGKLWLFPRLVAEGNWSRVGRTPVHTDDAGDPVGVGDVEVVLEPEETWERNARTGGVEDPRITWMPSLDHYVMTYSAYGPLGARVGIAVSADLDDWRRLGPLHFAYEPELGADLNLYGNKDAVWLPEPVPGPDGRPAYALLHRPTWDLSEIGDRGYLAVPNGVTDDRPGIWVSYADAETVAADLRAIVDLNGHREVATSEQEWESLKIGAGPPPFRTPAGWVAIFHGVDGIYEPGTDLQQQVRYCAGVMVHDPRDVTQVTYRSAEPLLEPEAGEELEGIVPNVVFPTAVDDRGDGRADVFYGMADSRIGWARLTYPT